MFRRDMFGAVYNRRISNLHDPSSVQRGTSFVFFFFIIFFFFSREDKWYTPEGNVESAKAKIVGRTVRVRRRRK